MLAVDLLELLGRVLWSFLLLSRIEALVVEPSAGSSGGVLVLVEQKLKLLQAPSVAIASSASAAGARNSAAADAGSSIDADRERMDIEFGPDSPTAAPGPSREQPSYAALM